AEDKDPDALAYLVRSLRLNPTNYAAVTRLATLLIHRPWNFPLLTLRGTNSIGVIGGDFSPDGKLINSFSDEDTPGADTTRVWDADTGRILADIPRSPHTSFSPDGKKVVAYYWQNETYYARVWDPWTGLPLTEPLEQPGRGYGSWPVFSPDGNRLFTR